MLQQLALNVHVKPLHSRLQQVIHDWCNKDHGMYYTCYEIISTTGITKTMVYITLETMGFSQRKPRVFRVQYCNKVENNIVDFFTVRHYTGLTSIQIKSGCNVIQLLKLNSSLLSVQYNVWLLTCRLPSEQAVIAHAHHGHTFELSAGLSV